MANVRKDRRPPTPQTPCAAPKPERIPVEILFEDAGVPFNPLDKDDPDITLSAEDRPIGGLGIFLCKQMMDHVEYHYEDGCNVLIMEKKIENFV